MSSSSPLPAPVRPSFTRHRSRARLVNGTLVAALVSVSVPGLATSASAAIVEPAPSPFVVTVFPQRDFVSVNWDGSGKELTFDLIRNGVVIGHAASAQASPVLKTDVAENLLEVNHPGGLCWAGSTPDILPGGPAGGDRVRDHQRGRRDHAQRHRPACTGGRDHRGGARHRLAGGRRHADGPGLHRATRHQPRLPQRRLAKRDLRATSDGGVGGGPSPTRWCPEAGSRPMTHSQRPTRAAVAGETRGMAWQATNAAGDRLGLTIFEAGLSGGPGMAECPAQASYSSPAPPRTP